jgi:site-specific DNA recombinase
LTTRAGAAPRPGQLFRNFERRAEFSAVVVPKLARFGRSVDLMRLFDLFDRDQITLIFLDMGIDTSTSQGRLLRHIMAAFAEYESDVKSDYIRAAYRQLQMAGRAWGGRPPFGYDRDQATKGYVINCGRASAVKEILSRRCEQRQPPECSEEKPHVNSPGNNPQSDIQPLP